MSSSGSDYEDVEYDSDEELQEAFSKGLLKPGLNVEVVPKKVHTNNVAGLQMRLKSIQQNLGWIERLDITSGLAPIAPEMAIHIAAKEGESESGAKKLTKTLDPALDDFKREMNFHRQAQAALLAALPRLHKLGIKTKRPDDYFAQMVKTDEHMQKVRDSLLQKKAGLEVSEKVRKIRQNRKVQKQLQAQSVLQRHKDKRELMTEVKKYRKGLRTDLDFLESNKKGQSRPQQKAAGGQRNRQQSIDKRKNKDSKFGFGGKKRGLKTNTKESAADVSGYRPPRPGGKKGGKKQGGKPQRPGKNRRNNNSKTKRR